MKHYSRNLSFLFLFRPGREGQSHSDSALRGGTQHIVADLVWYSASGGDRWFIQIHNSDYFCCIG